MLLFFGILAAAIFEMVGVGSIPVFLNLLLKPEEVFSYLPSNKYLNLLAAQDYFNQILFAGALLLTVYAVSTHPSNIRPRNKI